MALASLIALLVGAPSPNVDWTAPPQCPDEANVVQTVERYIQRELAPTGEPIVASATVAGPREGPFELTLRLENEDGAVEKRTLSDRDCAVLSDAAALMIAVALDPDVALQALEPAPQLQRPMTKPKGTPPAKEQPPPARDVATDRTVTTPPPSPVRSSCAPGPSLLRRPRGDRNGLRPDCGAIGAMFGVSIGPLPRPAPGVAGDLSALWPRLRLSAGAAHWFEQPARQDDDSNLGGNVRLTTAHIAGCYRFGVKRTELGLCARGTLGVARGVGVGISDPREDRLLWGTLGAGGLALWAPVRRLGLFARADLDVPLRSYRFQVGGLGTVHEPAAVAFAASIGGELRFP